MILAQSNFQPFPRGNDSGGVIAGNEEAEHISDPARPAVTPSKPRIRLVPGGYVVSGGPTDCCPLCMEPVAAGVRDCPACDCPIYQPEVTL